MEASTHRALNLKNILTTDNLTEPDAYELRQGLANAEFKGFYQPQLSLTKGTICGLEVLARWLHPQKGLLTPANFICAMERYNLIDELFLRILEQGLILQKKLTSLNLPLTMSFNLQPSQLRNPILSQAIQVILSEHESPAQNIIFEITETGVLTLCSVSMNNLVQLRILGCGLSMDDFGTGFSSLERLCDVPFTELKLDAGFIRKLDTHSACTAIVTHTISLAASLSKSLVIEGIETQVQLKQVKALGAFIAQGYAIAPPLADAELLPYILDMLPSQYRESVEAR